MVCLSSHRRPLRRICQNNLIAKGCSDFFQGFLFGFTGEVSIWVNVK